MAFNLMIVDDSPAMRAFIRRVVEMSGFDVGRFVEAEHGGEALQKLSRQWVDLVLTDINMPTMNGEELLRHLEQDQVLRSIPVLVVSTDSTTARMDRMRELGARGYIKKPFLPETLREEMERVLRETEGDA